ncbi:MAG: VOC family protein [Ignavibacteria bacterium]|jgi:predicted enzyme related to lactoylglutathione lyase
MSTKFVHTNIIAKDWKKLTQFYIDVFDCTPTLPERDLSGEWLDKGAGLKNAHLKGMHLKLPGCGVDGPTLEIYSYSEMEDKPDKIFANRTGFGHIAFRVDDVKEISEKALMYGGNKLGEISNHKVEGVGNLTFIYMTDPEGNIIEIQKWE